MTDTPVASAHNLYSSYREMLVEHLFAEDLVLALFGPRKAP